MKRFRPLLLGVIAVAASLPGMAASRASITPADVAAAVNRFGIPAAPGQVFLPADAVANSAHPLLRVESVQRWGGGQLMARLSCTNPGECVPFFAELRANGEPAQVSSQPVQMTATQRAPMQASLVHAGMPATLLLDGDHVHIRLTVICLQNGAAGQIVRATDKERRMFYTARVTDDGLLRGRL